MSQSTNKKAIVTRFDREPVAGFVQTPGSFHAHTVEILTPSGNLLKLPYADVKAISFVRDFEDEEPWRPHRSFATRPKINGLWVRLAFRDGDTLEGLIPNNLMLMEPLGFYIIPPEASFQSQRIFVPREALREVQVLGVIGSPLRRVRKAKPAATPRGDQLEMF